MRYIFTFLVLILLYNPARAEAVKVESTPTETTKQSSYGHIVSTNVLRCGYFTWPPFLSKNPDTTKLEGISNDIMQDIGSILDLKVQWTEQIGIADFMDGLKADKFDAVCISNWPQSKRFKEALATIPLYYTSIFPVVRNDDVRLDLTYSPLPKGEFKLGVIAGDATETMVQKLYPDAPRQTLTNDKNYSDLLTALTAKQVDVVFLDKSVINDFIKKNPGQIKIPKLFKPVYNYPEYLFVKKGDIETKLMLDNAIQLLRDSGDMQRLLSKYETSTNVFPLETFYIP